jgi:hypothetical protein
MWSDAADAIRYIENHLEIKLDTMFDPVTESYFIFARLELDGKVISEDRIQFDSI